jgi:Ran GTPase-activating protein (RanGAP) involved in mRNA processing and transport
MGEVRGQLIGQALAVNRVLTNLDLRDNLIRTKAAREIGRALQVNRVLTTLQLNGYVPLAG